MAAGLWRGGKRAAGAFAGRYVCFLLEVEKVFPICGRRSARHSSDDSSSRESVILEKSASKRLGASS